MVKALVDANAAPVRALPREERELIIAAQQRPYAPPDYHRSSLCGRGPLAYRLRRQQITAPAMTVRTAPLAAATISWPMMGP